MVAAGECEDGWVSHVYRSGAPMNGFSVSYIGLVTFGSSASVLSRGGTYQKKKKTASNLSHLFPPPPVSCLGCDLSASTKPEVSQCNW